MVLDGLRGYIQIASGLTEVSWQRAVVAAKALMAPAKAGLAPFGHVLPPDVRDSVTSVAEDLVATSKANRDLLLGLVAAEVERQVGRLGPVSADELRAATARAERLEIRVRDLERQLATTGSVPSARSPGPPGPARAAGAATGSGASGGGA